MLPCCQCSTASATVHPDPSFFRTPFHRANIQIRHIFSNCPVGECGRDPPLWRSVLGLVRAWLQMNRARIASSRTAFALLRTGVSRVFPVVRNVALRKRSMCLTPHAIRMPDHCGIVGPSGELSGRHGGSNMTMGLFEHGSDFPLLFMVGPVGAPLCAMRSNAVSRLWSRSMRDEKTMSLPSNMMLDMSQNWDGA